MVGKTWVKQALLVNTASESNCTSSKRRNNRSILNIKVSLSVWKHDQDGLTINKKILWESISINCSTFYSILMTDHCWRPLADSV